jgi:hypothetical protein
MRRHGNRGLGSCAVRAFWVVSTVGLFVMSESALSISRRFLLPQGTKAAGTGPGLYRLLTRGPSFDHHCCGAVWAATDVHMIRNDLLEAAVDALENVKEPTWGEPFGRSLLGWALISIPDLPRQRQNQHRWGDAGNGTSIKDPTSPRTDGEQGRFPFSTSLFSTTGGSQRESMSRELADRAGVLSEAVCTRLSSLKRRPRVPRWLWLCSRMTMQGPVETVRERYFAVHRLSKRAKCRRA